MILIYKKQLEDFIEIVNNTKEKFGDEYPSEITIENSIDFLDPNIDTWITYNGLYVTCADWLGGETINDEAIYIPDPLDHETYISICNDIMNRTFDYAIYNSRMRHYEWEIENYIYDFAKKVKSEWNTIFKNVSLETINIHFSKTESRNKDGDMNFDYEISGTCIHDNDIHFINLYGIDFNKKESNKITARHETLHYLLSKAGYNSADDSFLFWFLADVYDAHPYKEMQAQDKKVYDLLKSMYEENNGKQLVEQVFNKMQK